MSGKALEENETAENALSVERNVDSARSDAQLENKVEITVEVENEKHEETNISQEEGANKAITVDNNGENTTIPEMHGDVDSYQNTSEDDEEDDLWEDDGADEYSEEDDEETAFDEDEASEEEGTDGQDDEENSEEDDEETAIDKDEVSEQEARNENGDEINAGVEKEIAKGNKGVADEINLKKVKTSKERKEKNNVREESSKKLESVEKPKSPKRGGKKRVESMGMIFMCSSKTKKDCYRCKVLGLPESKKDIVEKIYPGMRLFLYDVDLRLMYGIYKARGRGGYNIEPNAFKSKFPSQVRFTVLADCLPLAEAKFKKVIKENYFTNKKFDCKLNSEQVKKLCKLFQYTNKGDPPRKLSRSRKAEKQPIPIRGEGSRKRRGDDRRRPVLKEKIRYAERPRKRPRKAVSPETHTHQPRPAPLPPSVPLIVVERNLDVDPYRRGVYVVSRDRDPYRHDLYESKRDRLIERRDPYPVERDPYLERRDPYRDERDPNLAPRDRVPYRDERDLYLDRHASYTVVRDSFPDRRVRYRDPDPYPDSRDGRDTYVDDQDMYTQRRVYKDAPIAQSYGSYMRDPVSDGLDVYRGDRGVAYRDSYRVEEVLDRPLSLERRRYDVLARDPYVLYRALPSTAEPLYSTTYPSQSGLTGQYRL